MTRRRQWQPTPVLLSGKSHGRRSLVGCSPWGREESGTTERLHFHFSLSCIGEGNGNPLQCSCLENPRDGEPSGLLSMGLHRDGHDWSDLAAAAAAAAIFLHCLWFSLDKERIYPECCPLRASPLMNSSLAIKTWIWCYFLAYPSFPVDYVPSYVLK